MVTKYILAALAAVFLILGLVRAVRAGVTHPQARTWLLIGIIFSAVSAWLFWQEA